VLDPPRVAEQATGANRLQINAGGFALGLFIGLGIIALRELRDTTYHNEADVATVLTMPVLAVVPFAPTPADVQREKRARWRFAFAAACVVVASGAVFAWLNLWKYVV
jgi:uncharacterized protein involved in exopolysaccharide biosynthesis